MCDIKEESSDQGTTWVKLIIQSLMTKCNLTLRESIEILQHIHDERCAKLGYSETVLDEPSISLNEFCVRFNHDIKILIMNEKFTKVDIKTIFHEIYMCLIWKERNGITKSDDFDNPVTKNAYRIVRYQLTKTEKDPVKKLTDLWDTVVDKTEQLVTALSSRYTACDIVNALGFANAHFLPDDSTGASNKYKGLNAGSMMVELHKNGFIGMNEIIREIHELWKNVTNNYLTPEERYKCINAFVDLLGGSTNLRAKEVAKEIVTTINDL